MKDLKEKVIVITGAGSGIGRALAYWLSKEKAILALCDIDSNGLQTTQSMIKDQDSLVKVKTFGLDVSKKEEVLWFAQSVIKDFGNIDVVINNAGVSSSGGINELTFDTLEWTMNTNLWGVINVTKAFLPYLTKRSEASIVNISSVYGLIGIPGQTAYCTSKFAVRGFTEALRQDLYHTNVSVTTVFPGGVKTNIARNSRTDYPIDNKTYAKELRKIEASFKTTPDEAAKAIIRGIQHKSSRVLIGNDTRKIDLLARFKPNTYEKDIEKYLKRVTK